MSERLRAPLYVSKRTSIISLPVVADLTASLTEYSAMICAISSATLLTTPKSREATLSDQLSKEPRSKASKSYAKDKKYSAGVSRKCKSPTFSIQICVVSSDLATLSCCHTNVSYAPQGDSLCCGRV